MEPQIEQLTRRGRQAFERRDYEAALADFRQILDTHPNYADIRHLAGLCLSFIGEPEAALEEFDRALGLNDRYIEAHLNRALTLNELGRFDEAKQALMLAGKYEREVGGEYPAVVSAKLANAHAAVGDLYLEAGAAGEAVQQYRTALGLRPRFADIRNKLAQALLDVGDLDAAEEELRKVLEVNPRFFAARLNLGLAHLRRGRVREAADQWEDCYAEAPNDRQVRAYLAMLQHNPSFRSALAGED